MNNKLQEIVDYAVYQKNKNMLQHFRLKNFNG